MNVFYPPGETERGRRRERWLLLDKDFVPVLWFVSRSCILWNCEFHSVVLLQPLNLHPRNPRVPSERPSPDIKEFPPLCWKGTRSIFHGTFFLFYIFKHDLKLCTAPVIPLLQSCYGSKWLTDIYFNVSHPADKERHVLNSRPAAVA